MGVYDVTLDLCRLEELLDKETRLDVLTEILAKNKYMSTDDMLRIIGSKKAIEAADKIMEE